MSHTGHRLRWSASTLFEVMEPSSHGRPQVPRATPFSASFFFFADSARSVSLLQPGLLCRMAQTRWRHPERPVYKPSSHLTLRLRPCPKKSCPPAHEGRIAPSRSWIAVPAAASVLTRHARVTSSCGLEAAQRKQVQPCRASRRLERDGQTPAGFTRRPCCDFFFFCVCVCVCVLPPSSAVGIMLCCPAGHT